MKKVLIVDDEVGFTNLLRLNLEDTGNFEVKVVNEGSKATEAAKWYLPDVILLDVIMPDVSGREVAEQLSAQQETTDTPIIFLTAAISREEATASGGEVDGYPVLAKPATVDEVLEAIGNLGND